MSHGGTRRGIFEEDPFFSGAPSFPEMGFGGFSRPHALGDGSSRDRQIAQRRDPFGSMWPFGGEDPFARMHSMMNQMMQNAESNSNSHCFSSSSVMHYSSGGSGRQPRMYQATTSTRQAPGGIKETRKSVRDSESGLQKMAIGHHINERSHVIERQVNTKTSEKKEHQELINLEEDDVPHFDREWKEKSHHVNTRLHPSLRSSHQSRALPSPEMSGRYHHTHKHHPYDMSHYTRPVRPSHTRLLEPDMGTRPRRDTDVTISPFAGGDHVSKRPNSPPPGEERRHKTHLKAKKEGKAKKRVQF